MSSQDNKDEPSGSDDSQLSNVYQQIFDEIATVKTMWIQVKQIEGKLVKNSKKLVKNASKIPKNFGRIQEKSWKNLKFIAFHLKIIFLSRKNRPSYS